MMFFMVFYFMNMISLIFQGIGGQYYGYFCDVFCFVVVQINKVYWLSILVFVFIYVIYYFYFYFCCFIFIIIFEMQYYGNDYN